MPETRRQFTAEFRQRPRWLPGSRTARRENKIQCLDCRTGPTCPLGQAHSGAPVERRVSDGTARRARVAGLGSAGAAVDVLVDPDPGSGSAERCQPGRVQPGCFIRQWSPGRTDDLDELA